ncbi:MAG: hypothetical protein ACD_2C00187G0002 [uncultured bacterium (gcode 4)]|uniref:Uncharacterized protein n=1 Tax=uncultured bacterium (gcode 4) TaxID=1234023 RepID=K2H0L7_9BACT|nr:MAG: hypothetical protein ACD_2C00187G0002 [uncultured bacterium (gcode 4)]
MIEKLWKQQDKKVQMKEVSGWLVQALNLFVYDIIISWYMNELSLKILLAWIIWGLSIIFKTWKENRF